MKTFMTYSVVFIVMFSFMSCDSIDELTEFDFNTTINEQLAVLVPAGEDLILDETMVINIVNDDTEEYLDVLQDVTITRFTYKLVNFTGDTNGTLVGDFVADGVALFSHDMVVKQTVDAGTVFEITDVSVLNSIANKLRAGNNVLIGIVGESSCDEAMNFTIQLTIGLAITADVL